MWMCWVGHRRKASWTRGCRKHFTIAQDHCPLGKSHTKEKLHISHMADDSRVPQPCSPLNPHKKQPIKVMSVEEI